MSESSATASLVYVVDDDAAIARLVSVNLAARGYRVKQFSEGKSVLDCLDDDAPDLMILDIVMPGINGLEVASLVRQVSTVPIMMLSVRSETTAKLAALDLGADDYVTKPFRIEELLARVRAILRRSAQSKTVGPSSDSVFQYGALIIDVDRLQVVSNNRRVHLTHHEWAILRILVHHAGTVISSRQLLQEAWGPEYGDEGDYIRTYITRLRRKLEQDHRKPRYILTERGLGYRMIEADPKGE
ncbi:MAG: hypothetical protein BZY88_19985 [SAR202 cluster bacterium Io17-Chloro-G9]|nr:MAG: hypothetical protein BZY88_19985 [SAR202 cluster bacterium Io17-Chloro-G9]